MNFCENLKKLRTRANMSQIELAQLMDVNQYIISYWEKGRSEPSISQIVKLSEIFKVPSDYLLGKEIIRTENREEFHTVVKNIELDSVDEANKKLLDLFKELGEEQKNNLITLINSFIKDK